MSTNVLAAEFLMHNFSSRTLPAPHSSCNHIDQNVFSLEEQNRVQFILGLVLTLLSMAIFLAPEKPQQFVSICEKYNGSDACQVW